MSYIQRSPASALQQQQESCASDGVSTQLEQERTSLAQCFKIFPCFNEYFDTKKYQNARDLFYTNLHGSIPNYINFYRLARKCCHWWQMIGDPDAALSACCTCCAWLYCSTLPLQEVPMSFYQSLIIVSSCPTRPRWSDTAVGWT